MKALRQLSSSSGLAHAGTARIIVLRGYSLLAGDKFGTSDPYVVVQAAGGKKEKTSVIKDTINPVWDETLELSVPDYASPVYLEVWDHDKIGMNDSLGTGEILLGQCEPGIPTLLTVAIDTQGTVEVEVTWLPVEREQNGYAQAVTESSPMAVRGGLPTSLTQSSSAVELSPVSRKPDGCDETQMGVATVRVLRGSNLRADDRGGKSDPYVVVEVAGGEQAKTSVIKGTVNPVWDEPLELSVPNAAEPLALFVWDHDKIGMNDSLGSGVISLAQCTPNLVTPLTLALFEQGESQQGTILVEVLWRPPEKRAAPSPAAPSPAAPSPAPLLSPVQLASRDAARKAATARQAAEYAVEAAIQAEWECEEMCEAAAAAKAAAGVARAARRVAAKEAEEAEATARVAAQQEAAETIAREKAARRASGHNDMPPPDLQEYHRLIIHVEHCMAERPSPMGSLQGAAERCARVPSRALPRHPLPSVSHHALQSSPLTTCRREQVRVFLSALPGSRAEPRDVWVHTIGIARSRDRRKQPRLPPTRCRRDHDCKRRDCLAAAWLLRGERNAVRHAHGPALGPHHPLLKDSVVQGALRHAHILLAYWVAAPHGLARMHAFAHTRECGGVRSFPRS